METIIDIQEIERSVSFDAPFHDLGELPVAKFTSSIPLSPAMTANLPRPRSRGSCAAKKWCVATALAMVFGGIYLMMDLLTSTTTHQKITKSEPVIIDPLNDLSHVFAAHGVESAGVDCLDCFFGDVGHIVKSPDATEAYVVYKLNSLTALEVVTHTFKSSSSSSALVPSMAQFWTAEDDNRDEEPDFWQTFIPEYQAEGSAMGWEKGTFFMNLPSTSFLKITLNSDDDDDGPERLHIGAIHLYSHQAEPITTLPSDTQVSSEESVANQDTWSVMYQMMSDVLEDLNTFDVSASQLRNILKVPSIADGYGSESLPSESNEPVTPPLPAVPQDSQTLDGSSLVIGTSVESEQQQSQNFDGDSHGVPEEYDDVAYTGNSLMMIQEAQDGLL